MNCKIWNIIEIAMEREGYDVQNAELSMRLYDPELQNDFTTNEIVDGTNNQHLLNQAIVDN